LDQLGHLVRSMPSDKELAEAYRRRVDLATEAKRTLAEASSGVSLQALWAGHVLKKGETKNRAT
jgi:hypothetical protein